jgi:DNA-binding GntR family transcriptional regulator
MRTLDIAQTLLASAIRKFTVKRIGHRRDRIIMPSSKSLTRKLYVQAYDVIIADIAAGNLATGERLTEVALANRLGISRAPIRQALSLLIEEEIIQKSSTHGYEIARPSIAGAAHPNSNNSARHQLRADSRVSWEILYDEVEKALVSRTSFDSWHVNEVALAKHYGVSRTVSRDVLARLQQRGLLIKDDKGRWLAPALSDKRVAELYEIRCILEPIALEKGAINAPRSFVLECRERLCEVIGKKKGADYPSKLDALEVDLHIRLLSYCDNKALLEAISLPQTMLVTQHFLFDWTNDMFDSEPFLPEHLAIFDHLLAGEPKRAAASLAHHLSVSYQRSLDRIHRVAKHIELPELNYLTRQI